MNLKNYTNFVLTWALYFWRNKMSKLFISKNTEAKVIATMWSMGIESLNPEDFDNLERIIRTIHKTRHIDRKSIGIELAIISGKKNHASDCGTNNAPAMLPTPCNCKEN